MQPPISRLVIPALPAAAARGPIARLIAALIAWQERARQRYRLAELDDRMLRDIGLRRADVQRVTGSPFWWS